MIRRPPRSTLFPTRRSSDLHYDNIGRLLSGTERKIGQKVQIVEKPTDRKSTRLNSSHLVISYAVFCLKKKTRHENDIIVDCHHHNAEQEQGTCAPNSTSREH